MESTKAGACRGFANDEVERMERVLVLPRFEEALGTVEVRAQVGWVTLDGRSEMLDGGAESTRRAVGAVGEVEMALSASASLV